MKKIIKLTEKDFNRIVKRAINEDFDIENEMSYGDEIYDKPSRMDKTKPNRKANDFDFDDDDMDYNDMEYGVLNDPDRRGQNTAFQDMTYNNDDDYPVMVDPKDKDKARSLYSGDESSEERIAYAKMRLAQHRAERRG